VHLKGQTDSTSGRSWEEFPIEGFSTGATESAQLSSRDPCAFEDGLDAGGFEGGGDAVGLFGDRHVDEHRTVTQCAGAPAPERFTKYES